jgi:hypothetical protein
LPERWLRFPICLVLALSLSKAFFQYFSATEYKLSTVTLACSS